MTAILRFRILPAIAVMALLCGAAAWADPPSQVGRLSYMSGSVSFQSAAVDEWTPAVLNYPLTVGDRLWTETGARAEVHVISAAVRLDARTDISFLNLDDQTVQIRLTTGSLNITRRASEDGMDFEIDTPNATVTLAVAGAYRVDVSPNGDTRVTVRAGRAEVTAGQDGYDVAAGRFAEITGLDSISSRVTSAARADDWDDWSTGRDRREDWVASNPSVSRDMIGVEDLNENGTWINDKEDGPGWVPSHVPAGWAPYRDGHWSWVAPWGWTWVDDAAWGFAPFHYGRWGYRNARWVWMPGASRERHLYAPALVIFVGGAGWTPNRGEGIGWFPLGPREVYIPSYTASTVYVQRINVAYVTNINVQVIERYNPDRVVYANRTAPRGITVVSRDVFVQSRPAGAAAISLSAAEATRAPLMGVTARVVPQRESIVGKPAAQRAAVPQPPPVVMSRRVYARAVPAPAAVPFAQQQKVLAANPGRPIDSAALTSLQRTQKAAPPVTVLVKPESIVHRGNTALLTGTPEKGAPAITQASGQKPTAAPVVRAPATAPVARAPAASIRKPAVTPAMRTPAAPSQKPAQAPAPEAQQEVAAPTARAPATSVQKPAVTPAMRTPAAPSQKPAHAPAPEAQKKVAAPAARAPAAAPVARAPAASIQKPAVAPAVRTPAAPSQKPAHAPAPVAQQKVATPARGPHPASPAEVGPQKKVKKPYEDDPSQGN